MAWAKIRVTEYYGYKKITHLSGCRHEVISYQRPKEGHGTKVWPQITCSHLTIGIHLRELEKYKNINMEFGQTWNNNTKSKILRKVNLK